MFENILNAIKRQIMLALGYEQNVQFAVNGTLTVTASTGSNIYCIKPLGAAVTIGSCTDVYGNAVSALAGVSIQQGDEFKVRLQSITFSSIAASNCVACYLQNTK